MSRTVADHPGHAIPDSGDGTRRVIVGVDGSPGSIAALRAGAWAAGLRDATLVAVKAWTTPLLYGKAPAVLPDLESAAAEVLAQALQDAFQGAPLVPVDQLLRSGTAAGALVAESVGADLLVVGSRGHGGFPGLLLGSVSMACTMHAHCPVLVMHSGGSLTNEQEAPTGARVVVGVGNGPGSVAVLRTAAQAAEEFDAELVAVMAWHDAGRGARSFVDLRQEVRQAAVQALEAQLCAAFPGGRPGSLRTELREGPAAAVLVDASRTADLLVVGRVGRSPLAGVLLGSVSLPVSEHASCPVLVVPGQQIGLSELRGRAAGARAS